MGMAQLLPADDAFTENATSYGFTPARYIRCEPYTASTVNSTTANWSLGNYHDAYMADVAQGGPAAAYADGADISRPTVGVLERSVYRTDATAYLQPSMRLLGGSEWSDTTFRCCGILGRISGGTVVNTGTRDEAIQGGTDGYAFLYHHRSTAGWWLYSLVRINAGVLTLLDSVDIGFAAGNDTPNHRTHPHSAFAPTRMWMTVRGTGSTVFVRCYRRRMGYGQQGYTDELIISYDDTNASRVVAAGRWGFGVQSAGVDSSGSECVGLASEFSIEDTQSTPTLLYCDLFERRQQKMGRSITDTIGRSGYSVMGAWVGDAHGPDESGREFHSQFLLDQVDLSDQVAIGHSIPTGQTFGFYISTRRSDGVSSANANNQHRSVSVRFRNTPSQDREAGIVLRFTSLNSGTYGTGGADADKRGYVAVLVYDGGSASFSVELRHYSGGGAHTVIASASTVPTGATFNAFITLDFECQDTDPPNLRPAMRVKVAGSAIAFTSQVSGVDVFGEWVVDGRTSAITGAGSHGEGLYFDGTSAATPRIFFDTWTQVALSDLDIDDGGGVDDEDDLVSIAVRSETSGKFDTLSVPLSWGVTEGWAWYQRRFDQRSGHRTVFADAGQQRRSFRLHARGVTDAERDELVTFLEDHQGSEFPFDWELPRTGEVIPVRFASPRVALSLLERGTDAFDFDIIEAFNGLAGGDLATASLDAISNSGKFWLQFYEENTAGAVNLTVSLDQAAPIGGVQVAYTLSGTAIQGTHYVVTSGASPLTFATGETSKTIVLTVANVTAWTKTRSLIVKLDASASDTALNSLADEARLYIRPTENPPVIEFDGTSDTLGVGSHDIPLKLHVASPTPGEVITPRWSTNSSSTATEGMDFEYTTDSGDVTWPTSSSTSAIPLNIYSSASGKTIVIDLKHEREAAHGSATDPNGRQTYHVDENLYTYCDDWRYVASESDGSIVFPGTPADNVRGPGGCISQFAQPVSHLFDPILTTSRGTPMNVLYATPGTPCNGYHRKDFEKEIECDGPTQAMQWTNYVRFSVKVELPTLDSPITGYSRYIRMSCFDRINGNAYAVQFDRESTTGGDLASPVVTSTGSWGAEAVSNWNLGGTGSDFGIDLNPDGETVLWFVHQEIINNGSLGFNRIIYPVNQGPGQNSSNWSGRGLALYDPRFEMDDNPLVGPPSDDYWPKLADWWEPIGNATIRSGGANQYTITVS